ncbi:uncharacterized protein EI90DRAFT_3135796 [Cantharellus anzutake]|uniref:uncharacterized protein n=1 Tax=Cantharellus anzutake TaxID=1750568 RepID=UPI001906FD03|nr:uncharacterized protein EI90DRAFT_3135796 [Cantharellus anzutake]KAF8314596.1 hypothetical protein EI90DRAFT_3135796 [Cantharellus anzutake]
MNSTGHVANAGSIGVHRSSLPAALPSFKHTIRFSQDTGAYAISAPHIYDGAFERTRPSPDHPDSIFYDQLSNFREWKITHITNSIISLPDGRLWERRPSDRLVNLIKTPVSQATAWTFEDPERPGHRIPPLDEPKYSKSKADINADAQRRAQDYLRSGGIDHSAEPVASMRRMFFKNRGTGDRITFEKGEHNGIAVSSSEPTAADYDTQEWEVELVGDNYRIRNPKSERYILSWISPPTTDLPVQALRSFHGDEALGNELPDSLWAIRKIAGEESYVLLVPDTTLAISQTDDPEANVRLKYIDGDTSQKWELVDV